MRIFYIFCSILLQNIIKSEFIASEVTERVVCNGSVTIYEGSNKIVVTKDGDIKATLDFVKVEGCGCFTLYSRKGGKGKSFFLGESGHFSEIDIGWSKVRSVRSSPCDRMANRAWPLVMPMWVVILIVVGIVIFLSSLWGLLCFGSGI